MRTLSALTLLVLAGLAPADTFTRSRTVTVTRSRAAVVQAAPVVVQAAPVVVRAPVVVQAAPVVVRSAAVYAPAVQAAPLAAPHCLDPVTAAQLRALRQLGY